MTKFERIKNMTIEEMAKDRVRYKTQFRCRSEADNWDFYDNWYETSDGEKFGEYSKEEAIKHEIELLNK